MKRSQNGANAAKSPCPIVATSIRLVTGHPFTQRCRELLRTAQRALARYTANPGDNLSFQSRTCCRSRPSSARRNGSPHPGISLRHSKTWAPGAPPDGGGPRIGSRARGRDPPTLRLEHTAPMLHRSTWVDNGPLRTVLSVCQRENCPSTHFITAP